MSKLYRYILITENSRFLHLAFYIVLRIIKTDTQRENMEFLRNNFYCGHGRVMLDAANQGRVFVELDGKLLHRYDENIAAAPDPMKFNNIGGNSLWPAPEGGEFAFNYLNDCGNSWLVQPGVNCTASTLLAAPFPVCSRRVVLRNRRGYEMEVEFRRGILPLAPEPISFSGAVRFTGYREEDLLRLSSPCPPESAVIAAWSLEQFPGSDNILTFGKLRGTADASEAINRTYYGDPSDSLEFGAGFFRFHLGGTERFQIGVKASARPEFIGAYDPNRNLLILRSSLPGQGRRIDIADNIQPAGVFGAADQYSIFNGGASNFFELETIAPVEFSEDGLVTGSRLVSETRFYQGPREELERLLAQSFGMPESFFS